MSATPIPRTLGLLMYGDLDISVLDELPPGRKPIKTWCHHRQKAAGHVRLYCASSLPRGIRPTWSARPSRKARWPQTCRPSKTITPTSRLPAAAQPAHRPAARQDEAQRKRRSDAEDFKAGELDVLVSTTVIEVGVDVPNANSYGHRKRRAVRPCRRCISSADVSGAAAAKSCCILISDNENDTVKERLAFPVPHDQTVLLWQNMILKHRGPGDFLRLGRSTACPRCGWRTWCRIPAR